MKKTYRTLSHTPDGKYIVTIDFPYSPTEAKWRDYYMHFMSQLRLDRMPRWNDRIIFRNSTYRVTSVAKIRLDDPKQKPVTWVIGTWLFSSLTKNEEIASLIAEISCMDCNDNCIEDGWNYMIHNHLWKKYVNTTGDGMLCVPCLEKRMKRTLVKKDFTSAPLNSMYAHPLLISRRKNITSRPVKK